MEEIFKTINYRETEITVSNLGTVIWNGSKRNWRFNADGYIVVTICLNGKGWRSEPVHKIVAQAFVENSDPTSKTEVHHIDFDRANPCANNLMWVTHKENVRLSVQNKPDVSGDKTPNWGNRKLSKKYAEDKALSKEKQVRPGLQNGRRVKIEMYYDGELQEVFDYTKDCMKYLQQNVVPNISLESIRGGINSSIYYNRPYKKHYTFRKVS